MKVIKAPEGVEHIGNFTKMYLPNERDFAVFTHKKQLSVLSPYVVENANENGIEVVEE